MNRILKKYETLIRSTYLPFAQIFSKKTPIRENQLFKSKFCGYPFLPQNFSYPKNPNNGKPLMLLAQINLAELPFVDKDLPSKGLLQFYIDATDNEKNRHSENSDDFTTQSNFKVILINEKLFQYPKKEIPFLFDTEKEYLLSFIQKEGPVSYEDFNYSSVYPSDLRNAIAQDDETGDQYHSIASYLYSKIGGYHSSSNDIDIRPQSWKNDELFLLLQVGPEECPYIFGDWGEAHFFILREDLKRRDFTNVLFCWDST